MIDGIDIPCTYKNGKQYIPKSGYVKTGGKFEKRGNLKFTLRIKGGELTPLFTLSQSPKVAIPAMKLCKKPGKVIDWATPPMLLELPYSNGETFCVSLDCTVDEKHIVTVDDLDERKGMDRLPTMCLEGDFDGYFTDEGDFIIRPKSIGCVKLYKP